MEGKTIRLKLFKITAVLLSLAGSEFVFAQIMPADSLLQSSPTFDRPINPDLYLIRPGEKLVVTPIKAGIAASELLVGPEGKIVDSRIGIVDVNGLTLSDVRKRLAEPLVGQFRSAQIDVSVFGPRLVSITVTGAVVHPGTYQLWTSHSVVDAITRAGGLLPSASTRRIEFSGGPKSLTVDLDRVQFARDAGANLPLYAGTEINVPLRSGQSFRVVEEVQKPREIELVEGDTKEIAVALAGGVLPSAAADVVIVNDRSRPLSDNSIRSGDIVSVPISSEYLAQRGISVFGAVGMPGRYQLRTGLTLGQAVEQAGGLTPASVIGRAVIFRRPSRLEQGSDTLPTVPISNLADATGKLREVALLPFDSIFVPTSIGVVRITGEVRRPGTFPFTAGQTVSSYVGAAGGLTVSGSRVSVSIRSRVTRQVVLASPESIVEDGDEVLISLADGRP
jgi:protein involved in polysaccharide export with SLBB domain